MSKEFTFDVASIKEDIVTIYSDSLDWELDVPLDFFPDPLKVEIDNVYLISIATHENEDIINNPFESGGQIKKPTRTKFRG